MGYSRRRLRRKFPGLILGSNNNIKTKINNKMPQNSKEETINETKSSRMRE